MVAPLDRVTPVRRRERRCARTGPNRVLGSQSEREGAMSDHVYKTIEITGSSTEGVTQAIDRAVGKAAETVRELDWFEVTEIRGHVADGAVAHYQVTVKLGFRLEG
jgi:flavin-binding protein dodecin